MTLRAALLGLSAALAIVASAAPCRAHLVAPGQATLHVEGRTVTVVAAIPAGALPACDDDGDGRLSADELARHRGEALAQLATGLVVTAHGASGRTLLEDLLVSPEHDAPAAPAAHVTLLRRIELPAEVTSDVEVRGPIFGGSAGTLTFVAARGEARERATLGADAPTHTFFRAPSRARPALGAALLALAGVLFVASRPRRG